MDKSIVMIFWHICRDPLSIFTNQRLSKKINEADKKNLRFQLPASELTAKWTDGLID